MVLRKSRITGRWIARGMRQPRARLAGWRLGAKVHVFTDADSSEEAQSEESGAVKEEAVDSEEQPVFEYDNDGECLLFTKKMGTIVYRRQGATGRCIFLALRRLRGAKQRDAEQVSPWAGRGCNLFR